MAPPDQVAIQGITIETRKHLEHEIEHLGHILPGQGPIETFVHHNTLHGFQHLHFEEALTEATRIVGGRGYLTLAQYRAHFAAGRITLEDLERARRERGEHPATTTLLRLGGRDVRARDVERIALLYGLDPLEPGEDPTQRLGPRALSAFAEGVPAKARKRILEETKVEIEAALARVGKNITVSELLSELLSLDVPKAVLEEACLTATDDGRADHALIARSLDALGIPEELHAEYLDLVSDKLDGTPAAGRADAFLEAEARKARQVLHAHFGVEGGLGTIRDLVERRIEEIAVLALFRRSLALFDIPDTFSPVHATLLLPEEPIGARIEALFERIEHLEAWGGPAIPLDPGTAERIRDAVRAHLDGRDERKRHPGVATSEIARLCLTVVHDLFPDHLRRRGFEALLALESSFGMPTADGSLIAELSARDPRRQMMALAARRLDEHLGRLGPETCHRDLLLALTGEDIHEKIHPQIVRVTMAFLDEGLAAWHVAGRSLGFYDAFRKMAEHDRFFDLEGLPGAREALRDMPPLAIDAIIQSLDKLGVPEPHWGSYLRRVAIALPGVSGMVQWRASHPEYRAQRAHPIDPIQYLAVRMFYEVLFVRHVCRRAFGHDGDVASLRHAFANHLPELFVRHALFRGELPDFLAERARAKLEPRASAEVGEDEGAIVRLADMIFYCQQSREDLHGGRSARKTSFRLFLLAQHLGATPGELGRISLEDASRTLEVLDAFSPEVITPIWHDAYEIHYRDSVLQALAANAKRRRRAPAVPPSRYDAQLVFCIDDREESIRRHLEEIRPSYETIGAAGFFGVAIDYAGLGEKEAAPLCPVVVTPAHRLVEVPRLDAIPAWTARSLRTRALAAIRDVTREVLRNPVSSYFLIDIVGLFSLVPVLGRVLFPRAYEGASRRARAAILPSVETEVPLDRENAADPANENGPPRKTNFSAVEQADRVAGLLRNMGLVRDFSPLVVLVGHGSGSSNNPHLSAYDCGACGGKHGGPNARVFARMANDPEVRALLSERGIDVPDDTWFVGCEHDTATDLFTYYDLVDVPEAFRPALDELRVIVDEAIRRSAHERCRKFESAPRSPTPKRALEHVIGRAADLSQARPELGHATNAFAIVGPRPVSKGVFLDRRSFLISYDPGIDPEGKILEGILLAVGPVCAGINLEYYFSTVDNTVYGCGTKVPHNVAGLIGVMEGASGDLRTGLPKQMIEVHEPMRLVMVVTARPRILAAILERQAPLMELAGNAWIRLVAMDPDTDELFVFQQDRGFVPWDPRDGEVPIVRTSAERYGSTIDFISPALIIPDKPTEKPRPKRARRAARKEAARA